jgi:cytochrome P450
VAKAIITQALRTAAANGHPLDEASCVSQVITMTFAGHDTSASTMSWVVYELTRHPEVEEKLVAELRQVLGDKWNSRDPSDQPTADELVHMQYLNAIIKEAMRLWPIGGTARWGPKGAVLNGFDVSHQMLYVDPYILHRNERTWGPDAQEFKPDRWLGANPVTSGIHPYSYQPFSKGPRDCIGQNLALLEMRAVLAELYRRFTFTYAGTQPERIMYQVTNKPKFGVMVRVHKRSS